MADGSAVTNWSKKAAEDQTSETPLHPSHGSQTGREKGDEQGATEHEVALQSFGAVICFSPTNL